MTDFKSLIRRLHENSVDFIVVGGFAGTVHGATRLTVDLDIVYSRTQENIENLTRALDGLDPYLRGAPPGLPFKFDAPTVLRGCNFTRPPRAAGRPKDFEAIAELERLAEEQS